MAESNRVSRLAGPTVSRIVVVTVALLFLAWLIDYIDRLVITLALPAIGKQFAIDKAAQGAILTAFFIAYALFQVPGGLLADRIGARRTMTLALTMWSVFTGLTGAAVSYVMLLLIRFAFGIFEGIFPGASGKALAERTPARMRLTANGVTVCSNPLGAAIAPLVAAPALALAGWQHAFFYVAGLGVLMAILLWFALPRPHHSDAKVEAAPPPARGRVNTLQLLGSLTMWKFTLMFFGFDIVSWGLVTWVPSYLITVRHQSIVGTGLLAAIPWFCATLTTIVGGVFFDRVFYRRLRWVVVPCMVITAVFLYLMLSSTSTARFVLFESIGLGVMFLTFMPINGLPLRVLPPAVLGAGTALVNFGGQAGGAIAPFVMGLLADHFGFPAAFAFLIFGVALAVAAVFWAPQTATGFQRALSPTLAKAGIRPADATVAAG
jgi:sugar phosphate permease